jgi:hypothetical protein
LGKLHKYEIFSYRCKPHVAKGKDDIIRKYYFGGRCQCLEVGELHGDFKVYDVNSMYPAVMRNYAHPISGNFTTWHKISNKTAFVTTKGYSKGAFPQRLKNGGLDFPHDYGKFDVTIHEYKTAIELGLYEEEQLISTKDFEKWCKFDTFVDTFYRKRMIAKDNGSELYNLFYKLVMNSSYGKFSMNPQDFKEWYIGQGYDDEPEGEGWQPEFSCPLYTLWQRPAPGNNYYNVATGASITGASRAELLRGLAKATRPIYCDTDSIICERFDVDHDEKRLGAWKLEATGDKVYIAGKKMYVIESAGGLVKKANKGALMEWQDIIRVAKGETLNMRMDAPTFSIKDEVRFIEREIKATGKEGRFG